MINTMILMTVSAALMAFAGLLFTFLPEEIMGYFLAGESSRQSALFMQVLGSMYFAFAMLNWMVKANLIGGIYSRPVAIANLTHFFVGGMAILKSARVLQDPLVWGTAVIYLALAVLFAIVMYTHPRVRTSTAG